MPPRRGARRSSMRAPARQASDLSTAIAQNTMNAIAALQSRTTPEHTFQETNFPLSPPLTNPSSGPSEVSSPELGHATLPAAPARRIRGQRRPRRTTQYAELVWPTTGAHAITTEQLVHSSASEIYAVLEERHAYYNWAVATGVWTGKNIVTAPYLTQNKDDAGKLCTYLPKRPMGDRNNFLRKKLAAEHRIWGNRGAAKNSRDRLKELMDELQAENARLIDENRRLGREVAELKQELLQAQAEVGHGGAGLRECRERASATLETVCFSPEQTSGVHTPDIFVGWRSRSASPALQLTDLDQPMSTSVVGSHELLEGTDDVEISDRDLEELSFDEAMDSVEHSLLYQAE